MQNNTIFLQIQTYNNSILKNRRKALLRYIPTDRKIDLENG